MPKQHSAQKREFLSATPFLPKFDFFIEEVMWEYIFKGRTYPEKHV
jgi:hypothetical protein